MLGRGAEHGAVHLRGVGCGGLTFPCRHPCFCRFDQRVELLLHQFAGAGSPHPVFELCLRPLNVLGELLDEGGLLTVLGFEGLHTGLRLLQLLGNLDSGFLVLLGPLGGFVRVHVLRCFQAIDHGGEGEVGVNEHLPCLQRQTRTRACGVGVSDEQVESVLRGFYCRLCILSLTLRRSRRQRVQLRLCRLDRLFAHQLLVKQQGVFVLGQHTRNVGKQVREQIGASGARLPGCAVRVLRCGRTIPRRLIGGAGLLEAWGQSEACPVGVGLGVVESGDGVVVERGVEVREFGRWGVRVERFRGEWIDWRIAELGGWGFL